MAARQTAVDRRPWSRWMGLSAETEMHAVAHLSALWGWVRPIGSLARSRSLPSGGAAIASLV